MSDQLTKARQGVKGKHDSLNRAMRPEKRGQSTCDEKTGVVAKKKEKIAQLEDIPEKKREELEAHLPKYKELAGAKEGGRRKSRNSSQRRISTSKRDGPAWGRRLQRPWLLELQEKEIARRPQKKVWGERLETRLKRGSGVGDTHVKKGR